VPQHTLNRPRRLSVGTGTAALSLGLCLCAGQLMTTTAANAATPVVTQAAVAKVTPKVIDSVNTSSVALGSRVRLTTKVINPKTGKVVTSGRVRVQAGYAPRIYVKVQVNKGAKVLAEAKKHTGALYKFAAAGPKRFDCSGFTMYVYKKAVGKKLPHKANSQQHYGKAVSKGSKKVGDLIIFRSGSYGYHAAIYAGNGYMYDSPHTGARVGKHKIYGSNYVVRRMA
jgi:cell wall-associated NlpC family hydrolase